MQFEVDMDTQALFETYLAGLSDQSGETSSQQQQCGEEGMDACGPSKRGRKKGKLT